MSTLIGIVLVLGTMILVHEVGHFIAAKLFGVRVEVFSIGFPPRLWGIRRGGTDYRLSAIPLGGYVKMAGDNASEERTGAPDEFLSKPRWQRAFIAFAGPAVNLLMPLLLLGVYFVAVGVPYPAFEDRPVEVIALAKNSPEGLNVGDRVIEVNGLKNPTWGQALGQVNQLSPGAALHVIAEKDGVQRSLTLPVINSGGSDWPFGYAPIPPIVHRVEPGMPAHRAGLKPNDRVTSINGMSIASWSQLTESVRHSEGKPVVMGIRRGNENLTLSMTPQRGVNQQGDPVYQLGILVKSDTAYRRDGLLPSMEFAFSATANITEETLGVLARLFTGKLSLRQLQSVVGIAHESGAAVKEGSFQVVFLMALISVNLGVLNLLPIPILDGGHILLLAIEGSLRRDLSLAFKERFVQVGFVFLLVILSIVMYFDVARLLPGR
ncbi:MAG TPA: RIP metalloprotease RseP [Candidatus Acidoferrales bacterium]|nr:RIP metalloprotease RseP [Candidatus Acidoferrales bacterium]